MDIYLKIARLYLEEQNHIAAEAYINRAALLQSEVTNKELHIVYKVHERERTRDPGVLNHIVDFSYSEVLQFKYGCSYFYLEYIAVTEAH